MGNTLQGSALQHGHGAVVTCTRSPLQGNGVAVSLKGPGKGVPPPMCLQQLLCEASMSKYRSLDHRVMQP